MKPSSLCLRMLTSANCYVVYFYRNAALQFGALHELNSSGLDSLSIFHERTLQTLFVIAKYPTKYVVTRLCVQCVCTAYSGLIWPIFVYNHPMYVTEIS